MKRSINKGVIKLPKKNSNFMTTETRNCIGWEVKLDK